MTRDMRHTYTIAHNIAEFYAAAPWETLTHEKHFAELSRIPEVGGGELFPQPITLGSIEQFFSSGGIIALAVHQKRIVGFAALQKCTSTSGLYGKSENVRVHIHRQRTQIRRKLIFKLLKEGATLGLGRQEPS